MRFLKKSQLNFRNVSDNSVAVQINGEVTLDTTNAVLVPRGTNAEQPTTSVTGNLNGMIRYNTDTDEFEGRQNGVWRSFRFKEATNIIQEEIGTGDDVEFNFEITSFTPPSTVESGGTWGPQNIIVLIENVVQISGTNYSVVQLDGTETGLQYPNAPYAAGWYVQFDQEPPLGKPITVLYGFDR